MNPRLLLLLLGAQTPLTGPTPASPVDGLTSKCAGLVCEADRLSRERMERPES
jgi:hypothetical protein